MGYIKPYYGVEDKLKEIELVDIDINKKLLELNELLIKRETYVKEFKELTKKK